MADTMQFDLVTPERKLASGPAREVRIPGADGDMTAMPDHAPTITTLRPGVLTVVGTDGTTSYAVTGGFAEVTPQGVTVLAERALPAAELTPAVLAELVETARAAHAAAPAAAADAAAKALADTEALGAYLGSAGH